MELILNLAWMLLIALLFLRWKSLRPAQQRHPHLQLIALGLIAILLFPAISVTDDLLAPQALAESDSTTLRRDHSQLLHSAEIPNCAALLIADCFPACNLFCGFVLNLRHEKGTRSAHPIALYNRPPPRMA